VVFLNDLMTSLINIIHMNKCQRACMCVCVHVRAKVE